MVFRRLARRLRAAKARIRDAREVLKKYSEEIEQVGDDLLTQTYSWWTGAPWGAVAATWIVVDWQAAVAAFFISILAIVLAAMVASPIVWLVGRTKQWFFRRYLR